MKSLLTSTITNTYESQQYGDGGDDSGASRASAPEFQYAKLNDNEDEGIATTTIDSAKPPADALIACALGTRAPKKGQAQSHLTSPDLLFGPYPSRAAAAAAASQMPYGKSPASPCSSTTTTTSTNGAPPEPTNALNLPHPASFSTLCLSGGLVEKLQAISEAGFNSVEVYENDVLHFQGHLSEIRDLCYELGLGVGGFRTEELLEGVAEPFDHGAEGKARSSRVRER